MCQFISTCLTEEQVLFGFDSDPSWMDSHESIVKQHKLDDSFHGNFVRVEITSPNGDLETPFDQWIFQVDQPDIPAWYNAKVAKFRVRQAVLDSGILDAYRKYQKVRGLAWAEYEKIEGRALAKYEKVRGPAWTEYEKVQGPAWAEYEKVRGPAWAKYKEIHGLAWAKYRKVEGLAWAKHEKALGLASAEYEKAQGPAWAKYVKARKVIASRTW